MLPPSHRRENRTQLGWCRSVGWTQAVLRGLQSLSVKYTPSFPGESSAAESGILSLGLRYRRSLLHNQFKGLYNPKIWPEERDSEQRMRGKDMGKGWAQSPHGGRQRCRKANGAQLRTRCSPPRCAESSRSLVSSLRAGGIFCTSGYPPAPMGVGGGVAQGRCSISTTWMKSLLWLCQVDWALCHALLSRCQRQC